VRILNVIRAWIRKLPIVSGLADCRLGDHWEAFRELVPNLMVSLMPIWVGAFVILLHGDKGYWQAILGNINNGELFLYAASLLGPIFYMSLIDPPGSKQFPARLSHMFLVLIISVLSAVAFGLQRAGQSLNADFVYSASWLLFVAALVLLYLATAFKNMRMPSGPEDFKVGERDLAARLKEHR
jgi:hypothetical protein